MKYIVPSSKIVFTDFMILLVSVLVGINSVMSFSEEAMEGRLPPVRLPETEGARQSGQTGPKRAFITILPGKNGKLYFYNRKQMSLAGLVKSIHKVRVPVVVLRGDRDTLFQWEEFCSLSSKLMKAGVKEISYAVTETGGNKP
jgi:hypothetical protein